MSYLLYSSARDSEVVIGGSKRFQSLNVNSRVPYLNSLLPALDHHSFTQGELQRHASIVRGIELGAILQSASVMNLHMNWKTKGGMRCVVRKRSVAVKKAEASIPQTPESWGSFRRIRRLHGY